MKKLGALCLSLCVLAVFAGCNTMKGAGQDVEDTGRNLKQTVEKND